MFSILIKLLLFIHVDNNDEMISRIIIGGVFGAVGGLFSVATIVLIVCGIWII